MTRFSQESIASRLGVSQGLEGICPERKGLIDTSARENMTLRETRRAPQSLSRAQRDVFR
jgi:hypothetical protein